MDIIRPVDLSQGSPRVEKQSSMESTDVPFSPFHYTSASVSKNAETPTTKTIRKQRSRGSSELGL